MSSKLRVMSWKIDFLSPFPSPLAERGIERSETGRGKRMKEKFPLPFPLRLRRGKGSAARQGEENLAQSTFQNRIADCTIKTPLL